MSKLIGMTGRLSHQSRRSWRVLSWMAGVICAVVPAVGAQADNLGVMVTIKPVHALVAAVMHGAGTPGVLVEGRASPHTFALRPSQASALHRTDVFVRVSDVSEPFTRKLVRALPNDVTVVTLSEIVGLTSLALRTGSDFERHDHGHDQSDDHGHDAHGHDHGEPHSQKGGAAEPSSTTMDPHIWLDPKNAKRIVLHIAKVLGEKQPQHAILFADNAAGVVAKIDALANELEVQLKPVVGRPFVVFHDAYQYFEKRFGLRAAGAVSLRPDVPPSARRLANLRKKVRKLKVGCVFAEPQFGSKVLQAVREGTNMRVGLLDPSGAAIPSGPGHYFAMMRGLGDGFAGCLR